jgi:hypothetical protein
MSVEHGPSHGVRDIRSKAKLSLFIVTPWVHLAVLIDSEGVREPTTYFFDQFIFKWDAQSGVIDL